MRANAWTAIGLTASAALLASCATGTSSTTTVVTPDLPTYSDAFQERLADEMANSDQRPCDPIQPRPPCAAWKRAVIDYGDLRDRIRAAEDTQ